MSTGAENSASSDRWLDLRRLREYAAISERTLRAWIHSPVDPLPAVRVGTKILVRKSDFDQWLEKHKVKPLELGAMVEEIVEAVAGGR
jgi:excisionase family DNA binding protein